MSPSWQQGKLIEFCKQNGIHVSAWSPLGAYKAIWGTNAVMESPILKEIASARQKSVAQVLSDDFVTIKSKTLNKRVNNRSISF